MHKYQNPWFFAYDVLVDDPTDEKDIVRQIPTTYEMSFPAFGFFFSTEKEAWEHAENCIKKELERTQQILDDLDTHGWKAQSPEHLPERYEKRLKKHRLAMDICENRKAK